MILLHVPALPDEPAVAISIPRDSYVTLADGSGKHKINSAYDRGLTAAEQDLKAQGVSGPELDLRGREAGRAALIATIESLTGTEIDHYAEINLAGFVELTDALGGVPVCLNKPVHDTYSGIDLPAGPQTVNGPWRWPSSGSGTDWMAATWTGSRASRRSSPGSPSSCRARARSPTRPRSRSCWRS